MSSIIKTHNHENYDILKEFSEAPDSTLLYKGNPISVSGGTSSVHESLAVGTEAGVHGLRYYNNKLQYWKKAKWNDIATEDIIISPTVNNALVKYSNGYFVQAFLISGRTNNALVKYSDGYYVPKVPANMATTNDIDTAKEELTDKLEEQEKTFDERYDIITEKLKEVAANTSKNQVHEYSGNNASILSVIDISTLYSLSSNVILELEFMIINNSTEDLLSIVIQENGIETLNDTLNASEIQKYKLPNIPTIEIFTKGQYTLYLYVTYI